ncbi:MAG: sigma-70 family RNA polymerase sigma factor [bacterium]|nr:sigma-70 family RNA polymerase sigma factor [bacterium]
MDIGLELITACINKERKAQYELYKRSYSLLMSVCRRYANDLYEADDLLNIGFLKILNNLDKYQPKIPFERWIRKVMINAIIDEFRKTKMLAQTISYVEEYHDSVVEQVINNALKKLNVEELYNYVKRLPKMSQSVFNLFAIDGYSHKEIGEMLKISEGTSKWHVNFAREKLKGMIAMNVHESFKNTNHE